MHVFVGFAVAREWLILKEETIDSETKRIMYLTGSGMVVDAWFSKGKLSSVRNVLDLYHF
jgi:hypothetical protein